MWAELSGLNQVFQCVKEVPVNMHRKLTKKCICSDFFFRGKLMKS